MISGKDLEVLLEQYVIVQSQDGGFSLEGILIPTPPEDSRAYTIKNGEIKIDERYQFSILHEEPGARTGLGYRLINPENIDKIVPVPSRSPIIVVDAWVYGGGFIMPSNKGMPRDIGFAGDHVVEARTNPYKIWTETTEKYCAELYEAHLRFKKHITNETKILKKKIDKDGILNKFFGSD